MIANNNTIVGWEVDVKDKLIRAIELLDDSIYYSEILINPPISRKGPSSVVRKLAVFSCPSMASSGRNRL